MCVFVPFVVAWRRSRGCRSAFILNVVLCILAWIPGLHVPPSSRKKLKFVGKIKGVIHACYLGAYFLKGFYLSLKHSPLQCAQTMVCFTLIRKTCFDL